MPHGGSRAAGDLPAGEEVIALGIDGVTTQAALATNGLTRKGYQVKEESTFHADEPLVIWDDVVRAMRGAGDGGVVTSVRQEQGFITRV